MARHLVGKIDDLDVDTMRKVVVDGEEICLAHAEDGSFYAIGDICTHEEYSLSDGELWGLDVECPAFSAVRGRRGAAPRGRERSRRRPAPARRARRSASARRSRCGQGRSRRSARCTRPSPACGTRMAGAGNGVADAELSDPNYVNVLQQVEKGK